MAAYGYGEKALRLGIPLGAYLELTYACNWSCVFCYNPRRADRHPLTTAEWSGVLDELRRLGTLQLTLTGGEPLARPDFFEIAACARERAFALRIFTNGSLVRSTKEARAIADLQPLGVELSLHGATAAVHDSATRRPGSFDEVWRAVGLLEAEGVRLSLKTPVTRLNEHEIDAMIALVAARGLPYRLDPNLTPRDDGDRSPLAYSVSREAREKLLRLGIERGTVPRVADRFASELNCGVGRSVVAIDPEGNVFPCLQWRHTSLGNVRETALTSLWGESEARAEAVRVSRDANRRLAVSGPELSQFTFCPALAAQSSGDPLAPDPEFVENARLASRIWSELPARDRNDS